METKNMRQSLYEILEIDASAPQDEIHQAFLRAKHTYSSDSPALYSVFSKEEADELMKMIEAAYSVLGNPVKRREYDNQVLVERKSLPPRVSGEPTPEMLAEADSLTETRIVTTGRSSNTLGRTMLSHYEADETFELEIENQEIWDGTFLQKVREYKGINLDQLTKFTKIGRHYLVALEANDFSSLPAHVFVRGFVSQISRILNLNEKIVTDSYMKLFKESRGK